MTEIKPHAAHWGTYDAVVRDGRVVRTQGLARDVLGGRWEGEDIIRTAMRTSPASSAPSIPAPGPNGSRTSAARLTDPSRQAP